MEKQTQEILAAIGCASQIRATQLFIAAKKGTNYHNARAACTRLSKASFIKTI
jgi:hypothetical protein